MPAAKATAILAELITSGGGWINFDPAATAAIAGEHRRAAAAHRAGFRTPAAARKYRVPWG